MREELKNAIQALEKEEIEEGYANKPTEEVITDLKSQLRAEEERAEKFKNELVESEKRERKLKKSINEIASIQNNPDAEARNKIAELEGTIAGLKEKLESTEKDKKEIEELTKTLMEKEGKLKILAESFDNYMGGKDAKSLSDLLLDDTRRRAEAEKWFNRAYDENQKGNRENAIEYYTRAIELNPEYAKAYNNRGTVYGYIKEYEKAISDYNKAIELNPEYADAYNNRGNVYGYIKEYEKAISDFNKAIELNPEYAIAYNNRGNVYGYIKEYEKAISDYNKAIELNPEYATTYSNRGVAYYDIKEYEKAISDYNKAIELNPEYAIAYEDLSELYITTGNYKSALETITEALSLSMEIKDRAVCLYLEGIAKKMLYMDISDCEEEFNEIHKREFEITWSFAEIESWLEDLSNDQKAFIIEKTELIKEHKR
uniref:Photosystem I assembly protein Ycf3 n=1 Tax=Candidatus Methanophaga sp. ANME-1 ERB7 TaxID=2759913 RepID=A0A7G9Z5I9_9EURY|nr:photosystem I assembly protein Ycf3 [Methanosarcinales archaeon ANME-1 ERB7]